MHIVLEHLAAMSFWEGGQVIITSTVPCTLPKATTMGEGERQAMNYADGNLRSLKSLASMAHIGPVGDNGVISGAVRYGLGNQEGALYSTVSISWP
jgi:hypothetical protein